MVRCPRHPVEEISGELWTTTYRKAVLQPDNGAEKLEIATREPSEFRNHGVKEDIGKTDPLSVLLQSS